MVEAIKTTPAPSSPSTNPCLPIFQGIVSGIASVLGLSVSSPITGATPSSSVDSVLEGRLSKLESQFSTLTNTVDTLTQGQVNLTSSLNTLTDTVNDQARNAQDQLDKLTSAMTTLANTVNTLAQTKSSSSNGSNNSNDSTPPLSPSTPPSNKTSPTTSLPTRLPEITIQKEVKNTPSFKDLIVTADLEAIITKEGYNEVYMAAWYNDTKYNIMDISQWSYNKRINATSIMAGSY